MTMPWRISDGCRTAPLTPTALFQISPLQIRLQHFTEAEAAARINSGVDSKAAQHSIAEIGAAPEATLRPQMPRAYGILRAPATTPEKLAALDYRDQQ